MLQFTRKLGFIYIYVICILYVMFYIKCIHIKLITKHSGPSSLLHYWPYAKGHITGHNKQKHVINICVFIWHSCDLSFRVRHILCQISTIVSLLLLDYMEKQHISKSALLWCTLVSFHDLILTFTNCLTMMWKQSFGISRYWIGQNKIDIHPWFSQSYFAPIWGK